MKQTFTSLILFLFSTVILSAQGYQLVKDFAPGTSSGWRDGSRMLDSMGSKALFMLRDAQNTNSIWISDGTEAGTFSLANLANGESVQSVHTWKGRKVILVRNAAGAGRFWLSDGSKAGTVAITGFYSEFVGPVLLDSLVYFGAKETAASSNTSLLRLALGSRKVSRILNFGFFGVRDLVGVNNKLMMIANPSGVTSLWLMSSDGTLAGTKNVFDFGAEFSQSIPMQMTAMGDKVFFYLGKSFSAPFHWYVSDGTNAGTKQLIAVKDNTKDFRSLKSLIVWNNKFYFPAVQVNGFDNTERYYSSDGTPAGTIKLEGLRSYQEPSAPRVLKGKLFFHAFSPSYISDLFASDGTAAGTTRPLDLDKLGGGLSFSGGQYVVLGDSLYLNAYRDETGWELWRSNGTTAGTVPIEWKAGKAEANPGHLLGTKDRIFMTIDDPALGKELWVYRPKALLTATRDFRAAKDLLSFSPNPAQGQVQVRSLRADAGDGALSIHNLLGQVVYQQTLRAQESKSIPLTGLSKGVYTLSLQQGEWLQVEKLMIH